MGTEILINLSMAGIGPSPVVLPVERLDEVPSQQLVAIWCEAQPVTWHIDPASGELWPIEHPLLGAMIASRGDAVRLKRPLAIWTDGAEWDLAVTPATKYGDQWWMRCTRGPRETPSAAVLRYDTGLEFCPLAHVVLVVGLDLPGETDEEALEHLVLCAELARRHGDVIGFVWVGTQSLDLLLRVDARVELPGPPPIIDIEPLTWGSSPTP